MLTFDPLIWHKYISKYTLEIILENVSKISRFIPCHKERIRLSKQFLFLFDRTQPPEQSPPSPQVHVGGGEEAGVAEEEGDDVIIRGELWRMFRYLVCFCCSKMKSCSDEFGGQSVFVTELNVNK